MNAPVTTSQAQALTLWARSLEETTPLMERLLGRGRPIRVPSASSEPASGNATENARLRATGELYRDLWPALDLPPLSGHAPIAPLRAKHEGIAFADDHYVVCVDPVHLMPGRGELFLTLLAEDELPPHEAAQLLGTLNAHFAEQQWRFVQGPDHHWYLISPKPFRLSYSTPCEAQQQPVSIHLPTGPDAMEWHSILNEVQMLFHEHPVNAEKILPINSIWPWGGGTLADAKNELATRSKTHTLFSDDATACTVAQEMGVEAFELTAFPQEAWSTTAKETRPASEEILVIATMLSPGQFEQSVLTPALEGLKKRKFAQLHLLFGKAPIGVQLRRNDPARWWRRSKNLDTLWEQPATSWPWRDA